MAEDILQRDEIAAARLNEARRQCAPEFIDDKRHAGVLANRAVI